MFVFDLRKMGDRLYHFRKKTGLTQGEIAEKSGISDRTYADIERGCTNMRVSTLLHICKALNITPNDILIEEDVPLALLQEEVLSHLEHCPEKERETALKILNAYLNSLP